MPFYSNKGLLDIISCLFIAPLNMFDLECTVSRYVVSRKCGIPNFITLNRLAKFISKNNSTYKVYILFSNFYEFLIKFLT